MLETVATLAVVVMGFLLYLVFFERSPSYSTPDIRLSQHRDLLTAWGMVLSCPNCSVSSHQLIQSGTGFYEHHLRLINQAQSWIHLESYILEPGDACQRILGALAEKARHGVSVRVVLDRVGSFRVRSKHIEDLVAAGAIVVFYHPVGVHTFRRLNNRSHRNMLIVDGEDAIVGGAGIADFWDREKDAWRDCALKLRGSCVTRLQSVFGENWLEAKGEILADAAIYPSFNPGEIPSLVVGSSPAAGGSSTARILFQLALASAQRSIDLCSPYFIPDRGLREALITAASRGVRIRVLTSGPYSDQGLARRAGRRRYGPLLESGIELHEYRNHMMHVKTLVIDEQWAVIGSTNVDNRSFNLNDEVNIAIDDPALATAIVKVFNQDLSDSEQITLDRWMQRSWGERILANLGRGLERHD